MLSLIDGASWAAVIQAVGTVGVAGGIVFAGLEVQEACRLPATWDQLAAGFASGMGPPRLPVMGPP